MTNGPDILSPEPLRDNITHPQDTLIHDECPYHPEGSSVHTGYSLKVSYPHSPLSGEGGEHIVTATLMERLECKTELVVCFS